MKDKTMPIHFRKLTLSQWTFLCASLLMAISLAQANPSENKQQSEKPAVPRPLPRTQLGKTIDGTIISLSERPAQPVVIAFWNENCPPCLHELPVLDQVQKRLGPKLVKIVAVGIHQSAREARRVVKKLRKKGLALEFTYDPNGTIGRAFGVNAIPHSFVVGTNGQIIYEHVGWGKQSLKPLLQTLKKEIIQLAEKTAKATTAESVQRP